jgi:hypothetical protein
MTGRDRTVVMVLATLGVLAAVWLFAVSPKREQAAKLGTEVSTAQAQLASAEAQLASAGAAQAKYQEAYASIVRLGKAVPASEEVPSLIYQLSQATNEKNVEFASITTSVPGAGAGSSSSSGTASTAAAGITQMPFTFVFNGSFDSLYNLFQELDAFTTLHTTSGELNVNGRLLTIQSVKLGPVSATGASTQGSGTSGGPEQLSGTITATAYVLPAGQSLTGGATPAGPAGATTQTASTGATGSSAATSSTNAPAVVQVTP